MNDLEKIQIEADRAAARTVMIRYLKHFLFPERIDKVESFIMELAEAEVIDFDWLEIY